MGRFIARRILSLIPVLLIVGIASFTIIHLIPGNPADVILGNNATEAEVKQLSHQLGLDRPLIGQFVSWFTHAVRGNLGNSIFYDEPVLSAIGSHFLPTLYESVLSTLLSLIIAWPTGLLAAWRRNGFLDRLFMSVSLLGVSIPSFWLGLMMILVFAVGLGWLPVTGYVPPSYGIGSFVSHMVLPVVVLSAGQTAIIARMLRDGVIENMSRPYVRTARAKGASETTVLLRHALPNSLIPTLTVVGTSFATLLSGVVVVEVIFGIPGLGNLIIQAIENRDYPLVEGIALSFALFYVVVNLLVDVSYALVDPRIRYR